MTRYNPVRRRVAAALAVVVALSGLTVTGSVAAQAGPAPLSVAPEPRDDEGGTKSLTDQLEDASKGFLEAQEALARSRKRQATMAAEVKRLDGELAVRQEAVNEIVREAYQTGRLGPMTAILSATSPDGFLDRASALEIVATKEDRALRELLDSKASQERAKIAVDTEVRNQQKQLTVMAGRKKQAESALKAAQVGGEDADGPTATVRTSGGGRASSARRSSDGSLPDESCSVNDPTTSGCITPRTLNAMNSAKADGFTRFVSCFRPQGSGEHPKGKACDFASDRNGFGGVATGSSREYGDDLADYFIANASRLGVLYVIWFKRIWLPSSGWKSYSRGGGDPSSDHTNHVHLSMR